MGLFTNIGGMARAQGAFMNYQAEAPYLRQKGYTKLPSPTELNQAAGNLESIGNANTNDLNNGRGYAQQLLKRQYGFGNETADNIVKELRGEDYAKLPGPKNAKHFRGVNQAPGSASTQVKINSPTQAEQVAAGMASTKAPQRVSDTDRIKLGDKDMRSFLAEQKLRVANDLVGGGYSRDQLVDMLNQPGVQVGDQFAEAFAGDNVVQRAFQLGEEGQLMRPEFETSDFVGEGQFGRVSELAPGYVIKEQEPLVDFAGYRTDGEGNTTSPRGKNLSPGGGSIRDYRDVADEVDQLKYLNKKHITPGVEAFNINDDGSTEVIMRDLRDNFQGGNEYYDEINERYNSTDPKVQAQAMKDARVFEVKRRQQEAAAAMAGIELRDRHEGNVMRNKMTGRPLQIDPSGRKVEGVDRTNAIQAPVVDAFYKAGLTDEAQIFEGLLQEASAAGDYDTYKDLVQQGASRIMKMKNVVDADEYTSLLGV